MVCIYCGQTTKVTNSRLQIKSNTVWRRRRCQKCGSIFTTHEVIDLSGVMIVSNFKATKMIAFSRDKLFLSICKSCGHRQDAVSCASALVDTVIQHLLLKDTQNSAVVLKSDIINITKTTLNRFDKVAAISYGAYHQLLGT